MNERGNKSGKYILVQQGQNLAFFIGALLLKVPEEDLLFARLPKKKMKKGIYEGIQASRLECSDYLPHQCGKNGQVLELRFLGQ